MRVSYLSSSVCEVVPTCRILSRAELDMLVLFHNTFAPITSLGCSTNPNLGQFARIQSLEAFRSFLFLPEHVRAGGDQHGDDTLDFENLFNKHIVELLLLYYGIHRMDLYSITRLVPSVPVFTSICNLRALSGQGTMVALIRP